MFNIEDLGIEEIKALTQNCDTKEEFLSIIDNYIERSAIKSGDWILSKSDRQNVYKVISVHGSEAGKYYSVESFFFRGPCKIFGDFIQIKDEIEVIKYDVKLEKAKRDWK